MTERIVVLLLDESKWLTLSMLLAIIAVLVRLKKQYRKSTPQRRMILEAMNLFSGYMVGTMSFGHLLAVTVKQVLGTLEGSVLILYPLGFVLAVPSWWMVFRIGKFLDEEERWKKRITVLNTWLILALLAVGPHNVPLALPAAFSIAYQFHSGRAVGWAIVAAEIVLILGLFAGSVVFFISGQNFEQFKGMQ